MTFILSQHQNPFATTRVRLQQAEAILREQFSHQFQIKVPVRVIASLPDSSQNRGENTVETFTNGARRQLVTLTNSSEKEHFAALARSLGDLLLSPAFEVEPKRTALSPRPRYYYRQAVEDFFERTGMEFIRAAGLYTPPFSLREALIKPVWSLDGLLAPPCPIKRLLLEDGITLRRILINPEEVLSRHRNLFP